jgi:HK97 gp10 family phage protein
MADGVTFRIPELQAFLSELQELPMKVQQRLLKGAVATAASVVRKEAVLQAPIAPEVEGRQMPVGTLKKSIYQTRLPEKCTATLEVWKVDVRTGKRTTKKGNALPDAYYAGFVEYGHYARQPKAVGSRKARRAKAEAGGVRWVAAKPFMRPAFEKKKNEAVRAMEQYLRENIPAAVAANKFIKAVA